MGTVASIDLGELKAILTEQVEDIAEELLGPPNKDTRRRSEWRWGPKGGQSLIVRGGGGKARGVFYDHKSEHGGGVLDLIMFARSCTIGDAIRWAKGRLGIDETAPHDSAVDQARREERERQRAQDDREALLAAQNRADFARRLWSETVPPADTVAAIYVTATRGIPLVEDRWPAVVRFHPRSNSLILAGTADDGTVMVVQRVFLSADGCKIGVEEIGRRKLRAVKQTNGPCDGAWVRLPGDPDGPLLLAEGPETGLSVWAATGFETWIALGQVSKVTPPAGRPVLVCRDDDRPAKPGRPCPEQRHRKLVRGWVTKGVLAVQALPWAERRHDGSDFNDVIQAEGPGAVAARIELALAEKPRPPRPSTVWLAERRLRRAVNTILDVDNAELERTLNRETFVVAQHVGAGTLDGRRASADLYAAAVRRALPSPDAVRAVTAAMQAGLEQPVPRWAPAA